MQQTDVKFGKQLAVAALQFEQIRELLGWRQGRRIHRLRTAYGAY